MRLGDEFRVITDLFEHKTVQPHFINPCCFGEDFATWLRGELAPLEDAGFDVMEPIQEDYGWGFWTSHGRGTDPFWVAVGCVQEEPSDGPAEWVVMFAYDPGLSLIKRLFHKPNVQAFDQLRARIRHSLEANPAITIVS